MTQAAETKGFAQVFSHPGDDVLLWTSSWSSKGAMEISPPFWLYQWGYVYDIMIHVTMTYHGDKG